MPAMRGIHPPQRQRRCCGGRVVKTFRRPPTGRNRDRNGGLPRLSDGVAHASRCPASAHAPGRKPWYAVSMGHDQRSLISGDLPGTLPEPRRRRMVKRTAPATSRAGGGARMPHSGRVRQPTGQFTCKKNSVVENIVCMEIIFIKLVINKHQIDIKFNTYLIK